MTISVVVQMLGLAFYLLAGIWFSLAIYIFSQKDIIVFRGNPYLALIFSGMFIPLIIQALSINDMILEEYWIHWTTFLVIGSHLIAFGILQLSNTITYFNVKVKSFEKLLKLDKQSSLAKISDSKNIQAIWSASSGEWEVRNVARVYSTSFSAKNIRAKEHLGQLAEELKLADFFEYCNKSYKILIYPTVLFAVIGTFLFYRVEIIAIFN